MNTTVRVVHYLNQFFGQIGGEDAAGVGPSVVLGPVGPGILLQKCLGQQGTVVATVICGDNYMAQRQDSAVQEIVSLIRTYNPDLVIAGPAFNAGRYGPACGALCSALTEMHKIPAVTGMYPENPGVEMYRRHIICVATGGSAASMGKVMPIMARVGLKLVNGETVDTVSEDGLIPRGYRRNAHASRTGAQRAVDMLLKRVNGQPFTTELPLPVFENVRPADAVLDLGQATIALVTEGGIVARGNPNRLESARATKFIRHSIEGVDSLLPGDYQSVHGGYDNAFANEDPNRVVPLDAVRDLVREGRIGGLYPHFFSTTGNGTSLANASAFGAAIARELKQADVSAVLLTAT